MRYFPKTSGVGKRKRPTGAEDEDESAGDGDDVDDENSDNESGNDDDLDDYMDGVVDAMLDGESILDPLKRFHGEIGSLLPRNI